MTASIATPAPPTGNPPPTAAPARPLRVLAMPGLRSATNPYTRLLYQGVIETGGVVVEEFSTAALLTQRWDVIHLHWPEYLLRSRKAPWLSGPRRVANLAALQAAKKRGAKLFWTVHNLKPHGLPAESVWRPYQQFLELVDGLFYLSADSRRLFADRYPAAERRPGFLVPHGTFAGVYPTGETRESARQKLGLPVSATVAVAVGSIERYKNLASLVREHAGLGREDFHLVVAGRPADRMVERELRDAAADHQNVQLHLRFIEDDELQVFFAAADFCAAPYSDILNSGAMLLALGFGRPVLCPAIGSLVDLQRMVGREWVMTYEGEFSAAALAEAAVWSRSPRAAMPSVDQMRWSRIGEQTLAAYREVVGGPSATRIDNRVGTTE